MVNLYRIKLIKDITENAIKEYSKKNYSVTWKSDVEYIVLELLKNNKETELTKYFSEKQLGAMKDLLREGYWIKYKDISMSEWDIVLYKLETQND